MFSKEIFYFSIVLVGLLVMLTGLCLYLMIKKMMDNKNRTKIEKYKEEYQLALFQLLHEGIEDKRFLNSSPLQTRALVELLAGFSKVLSSPNILKRVQEFAEDHLQPFILSQLKHRRWSIRMNALYWIQDFRMSNMREPLRELRDSGSMSKSEEIQLLKIDVLFNDRDLLPRLTDTLHELTEFEYSLLFQSLGKGQFQPLVQAFDELPDVMKYALIDSIGVKNRMEHIAFLQRLLTNDSTELRIRALKAVVGMEYYLDIPTLSIHLRAESWQERLMAIKACEYIRSPELSPYLQELMSDPSFYVRSQAAQSLLRLENGKSVLGEMAVHAEDGYARDMAAQWLERGAVS